MYEPTLTDKLMVLEVERDLHTLREEYDKAYEVEVEQFNLLRQAVGLATKPPSTTAEQ